MGLRGTARCYKALPQLEDTAAFSRFAPEKVLPSGHSSKVFAALSTTYMQFRLIIKTPNKR